MAYIKKMVEYINSARLVKRIIRHGSKKEAIKAILDMDGRNSNGLSTSELKGSRTQKTRQKRSNYYMWVVKDPKSKDLPTVYIKMTPFAKELPGYKRGIEAASPASAEAIAKRYARVYLAELLKVPAHSKIEMIVQFN
jgi:hypothetical protein